MGGGVDAVKRRSRSFMTSFTFRISKHRPNRMRPRYCATESKKHRPMCVFRSVPIVSHSTTNRPSPEFVDRPQVTGVASPHSKWVIGVVSAVASLADALPVLGGGNVVKSWMAKVRSRGGVAPLCVWLRVRGQRADLDRSNRRHRGRQPEGCDPRRHRLGSQYQHTGRPRRRDGLERRLRHHQSGRGHV